MRQFRGRGWGVGVGVGGGGQREGYIDPDAGISPCANRMGKHAYQAHFDDIFEPWRHKP